MVPLFIPAIAPLKLNEETVPDTTADCVIIPPSSLMPAMPPATDKVSVEAPSFSYDVVELSTYAFVKMRFLIVPLLTANIPLTEVAPTPLPFPPYAALVMCRPSIL